MRRDAAGVWGTEVWIELVGSTEGLHQSRKELRPAGGALGWPLGLPSCMELASLKS